MLTQSNVSFGAMDGFFYQYQGYTSCIVSSSFLMVIFDTCRICSRDDDYVWQKVPYIICFKIIPPGRTYVGAWLSEIRITDSRGLVHHFIEVEFFKNINQACFKFEHLLTPAEALNLYDSIDEADLPQKLYLIVHTSINNKINDLSLPSYGSSRIRSKPCDESLPLREGMNHKDRASFKMLTYHLPICGETGKINSIKIIDSLSQPTIAF